MRVDAKLMLISVAALEKAHKLFRPTEAILKSMRWRGYNYDFPILCYEQDHGFVILDGHHRAFAAVQCGILEIPAWVVSAGDMARVLAMCGGELPRAYRRLFHDIYVRGTAYARLSCDDQMLYETGQYTCHCSALSADEQGQKNS